MKIFTFLFTVILLGTGGCKLSSVVSLASKTNDLDHFSNSLRESQLSGNLGLENVLHTIFTQIQTKNTGLIKEELMTFFKRVDDNITNLNTE
jgi:hypothetical protein